MSGILVYMEPATKQSNVSFAGWAAQYSQQW